jgi:hypothetical protein
MHGSAIRGLTIFHCVMLTLYLLVSISYWFPLTTSRIFKADKCQGPVGFVTMVLVLMVFAAIAEFFVNFGIRVDNVSSFNSIDNFYNPAPCGQTRQLKSGMLFVASQGKMYDMMWVSKYACFSLQYRTGMRDHLLTSPLCFCERYRLRGASSTSSRRSSYSSVSHGFLPPTTSTSKMR